MDISAESLALHYKLKGKLEVVSRYPIQTQKDLSLAYTPGVAAPCLEIQKDPAKSFQLTRRQNMVAVITDGSAVLGLGNIGPVAGMPVMEGKCVLFKEFGLTSFSWHTIMSVSQKWKIMYYGLYLWGSCDHVRRSPTTKAASFLLSNHYLRVCRRHPGGCVVADAAARIGGGLRDAVS